MGIAGTGHLNTRADTPYQLSKRTLITGEDIDAEGLEKQGFIVREGYAEVAKLGRIIMKGIADDSLDPEIVKLHFARVLTGFIEDTDIVNHQNG